MSALPELLVRIGKHDGLCASRSEFSAAADESALMSGDNLCGQGITTARSY